MKICIISNLYNPYIMGGAEIITEKLTKALSKEEEVFVITTRPFKHPLSLILKQEIKEGIKIYRFYPLNLYSVYRERGMTLACIKILWHTVDLWNIYTFFVVLIILKKEKPQIVHTHNLAGLSFSLLLATKLLRIPLVHTLHDYHLICPYGGLMCPYTKFNICKNRPFPCKMYTFLKKNIVSNVPKVVIGPSKFIIDIHKRYGLFNKTTIQVIPHFIENIKKSRERDNKNKETLDMLYIGRLIKEKGVDILIEAFKDFKESFLRLHIVGAGNQKGFLEKEAAGDGRIKFYGKVLSNEVEGFYGRADVSIIPSIWYEIFGLVIVENFAYRVPIIGSNIGGIPELIDDGYNGFLFTAGNKESLKQKLQIFIEDFKRGKKLLMTLSEGAYESSKKFSREYIMPQILNIYYGLFKRG